MLEEVVAGLAFGALQDGPADAIGTSGLRTAVVMPNDGQRVEDHAKRCTADPVGTELVDHLVTRHCSRKVGRNDVNNSGVVIDGSAPVAATQGPFVSHVSPQTSYTTMMAGSVGNGLPAAWMT